MWHRVTDMRGFFGRNFFSEALIGLFLTEQKWLKPTASYMMFFTQKLHPLGLFWGWETLLCWNHEWSFRTLVWQLHYVLGVAVGCFSRLCIQVSKNKKTSKWQGFIWSHRWEGCARLDARGNSDTAGHGLGRELCTHHQVLTEEKNVIKARSIAKTPFWLCFPLY